MMQEAVTSAAKDPSMNTRTLPGRLTLQHIKASILGQRIRASILGQASSNVAAVIYPSSHIAYEGVQGVSRPVRPSTPSSWVSSWLTTLSVTPVESCPLWGAMASNSSKNMTHGAAA